MSPHVSRQEGDSPRVPGRAWSAPTFPSACGPSQGIAHCGWDRPANSPHPEGGAGRGLWGEGRAPCRGAVLPRVHPCISSGGPLAAAENLGWITTKGNGAAVGPVCPPAPGIGQPLSPTSPPRPAHAHICTPSREPVPGACGHCLLCARPAPAPPLAFLVKRAPIPSTCWLPHVCESPLGGGLLITPLRSLLRSPPSGKAIGQQTVLCPLPSPHPASFCQSPASPNCCHSPVCPLGSVARARVRPRGCTAWARLGCQCP